MIVGQKKMILNYYQISTLCSEIKPLVIKSRIQKIDLLSSNGIFIFSIYHQKLKKLFICLNRSIGMGFFLDSHIDTFYSNFKLKNVIYPFFLALKKVLLNSYITDISTIKSERVLKITTIKKKLSYILLVLIPGKENLILLDHEFKIVHSFYQKNLKYYSIFDFNIFSNSSLPVKLNNKTLYSNLNIKSYFFKTIFQIQKRTILKKIHTYLNKYTKHTIGLQSQLSKCLKFKFFEIQGNLIKYHPHLFKQYKKSIILDNLYEAKDSFIPKISIPLNEEKTVKENMLLFFKKSKN